MNRAGLVLLCLCLLLAPELLAASEAPALSLPAGNHEFTLHHEGRERFYLVRVPEVGAKKGSVPVVLSFHGGGGAPEGHRQGVALDALADREGFLAVYPGGSAGRMFERRLLTWNAGHCCGAAAKTNADDVGFVLALLADLASRTDVDATRVYAMGHSNGAMLSMRLAYDAGSHLAAIVAVGGVAKLPESAPDRPVPMLQIHSVDDPRALYAGGLGPPFPMTRSRVDHAPVRSVLDVWAGFAGCESGPAETETRRAEGEGGAHTATHLVWPGCKATLEHWRLTGAGHGWPGAAPARRRIQKRIGPATQVIDATGEAWRFFERHRNPGAPALAPASSPAKATAINAP